MDCQKAQQKMIFYVAKDPFPHKDELLFHLENCHSCGEEFIKYQQIQWKLRYWRETRKPFSFDPQTLETLKTEIQPYSQFYQHYPRLSWILQQKMLQTAVALFLVFLLLRGLPLHWLSPCSPPPIPYSPSKEIFSIKQKKFFLPRIPQTPIPEASFSEENAGKIYFMNSVSTPENTTLNQYYMNATPILYTKKTGSSF
jgi:hypothetical protein